MKQKIFTLCVTAIICLHGFGQLVIGKQVVTGGSSGEVLTSTRVTNDTGLVAGGYSFSNISADKTQKFK